MEINHIFPGHVESMIEALKAIGKGSLAEQIAVGMQDAVKATAIEGKKSTITIKLDISKQSDEMVGLTGECIVKIPKPKPSSSFFFDAMKDYQIGRSKPDQQMLPPMR